MGVDFEGKSLAKGPGNEAFREPGIDTIIAPATPPGQSALAIIRVSGPKCVPLMEAFFRRADGQGSLPSPGRSTLGNFSDLDQVMLTRFQAPRSFTGEDVLEISCHGNPAIVRAILACCLDFGCRMAVAGEFSRRAYTNGKMDLLKVDALAAVIAAQSEAEVKALRYQYEGKFSDDLNGVRQHVIEILAWIEADIDFGEREVDDVVPVAERQIAEEIANLSEKMSFFEKRLQALEKLREGQRIVLCGKPNVGKSSLFNVLLGQNRALVDSTPGTTRDFLEAGMMLSGLDARLVDTAGFNSKAVGVEKRGIEEARRQIDQAGLVVCVFDVLDDVTQADLAEFLPREKEKNVLVLLNKADLVTDTRKKVALMAAFEERVGQGRVFWVSAKTLEGMAAVETFFQTWAGNLERDFSAHAFGLVLTVKQREIFQDVAAALSRVQNGFASGVSTAILTFDLKNALNGISRLLGNDVIAGSQSLEVEEILSQVFKQFCIGK